MKPLDLFNAFGETPRDDNGNTILRMWFTETKKSMCNLFTPFEFYIEAYGIKLDGLPKSSWKFVLSLKVP